MGLEILLAESLRVAHESGALRTKDLARVTVDTTVQPKDITFPTNAKLLHAAVKGLTRLARKRGVRLRHRVPALQASASEIPTFDSRLLSLVNSPILLVGRKR